MDTQEKPRILKFGGTSVGTASSLASACRVIGASARERRTVVVASALAGVTDALVEAVGQAERGDTTHRALVPALLRRHVELLAGRAAPGHTAEAMRALHRRVARLAELLEHVTLGSACRAATRAEVLALGERLSVPVVAAALRACRLDAAAIDAAGLIRTTPSGGEAGWLEASVDFPATRRLVGGWWAGVTPGTVPVVTGFLGGTADGRTTLLGRGGSDYTAAILGHALEAERVEIWTDVDGVLSADPRVVPGAHPLPRLAYAEAAALASAGAKVLHPRTVAPLAERAIPVFVRNTLRPERPGTLVTASEPPAGRGYKAVASRTEGRECAVTLVGGAAGEGQRVRAVLGGAGVRLEAAPSEGPDGLTVRVAAVDGPRAVEALHRVLVLAARAG